MTGVRDSWGFTAKGASALDKARMKILKREADWFFSEGDRNKDGKIDRTEARTLLDSIKMIPDPAWASSDPDSAENKMWVKPLSGAEFDMVFKLASGGDGGVTRKEIGMLLSLHRAVSRWRHVIEKVFAEYDTDNNGSLDAAELGLFARKLDPKASADEVNTLLAKLFKVDKNGDGTLSREELLTAICYWRSVEGEKKNKKTARVEPSSNVVEAVAVPVVYVLPADALLELVDMSAPIVATAVAIPT